MSGQQHCNVEPRYTAGSPAQVPYDVALRVAAQERSAHAEALEAGGEEAARARRLGLGGIVELRTELRDGWAVRDLVTGDARGRVRRLP